MVARRKEGGVEVGPGRGLKRPPRVLLIEDDPSVAAMYRLKLEVDGFEVHIAADGEAGIDMAATDVPDLIVLDIRLPKLAGDQVLERLARRSDTARIPVVVVSNYSDQTLIDRCLRLGAREYLIKSRTTPGSLSACLRRHLESTG